MLWLLTQHLATVGLLILIVATVCRVGRLSPATRHVMWLVVLLKLMTPPVVVWPWTFEEIAIAVGPASAATSAASPSTLSLLPDTSPTPSNANSVAGTSDTDAFNKKPNRADSKRTAVLSSAKNPPAGRARSTDGFAGRKVQWLMSALWGIWLCGSGFVGVRCIGRFVRLERLVMRGSEPPEWLAAEAQRLAAALKVRRPMLVVMQSARSPFVWCFRDARLIWPVMLTDAARTAEARGILVHELAHLRRRDHWVAWLEFVAGTVWWWCPLWWHVHRAIRINADLDCDAWVVRTLPDSCRAYAEALIELSEKLSRSAMPLPAVGALDGSRRSIERRLTMIMRNDPPPFMAKRCILFAGILAFAALPGFSLGQRSTVEKDQEIQSPTSDGVDKSASSDGKLLDDKPVLSDAVVPREQLRFEGKTFDQWKSRLTLYWKKDYLKTKVGECVETIRAIGMFGVRGYGSEAATAIWKFIENNDVQPYEVENNDPFGTLRANTSSFHDAAEAELLRIGPPAMPVLIDALSGQNRGARLFASEILLKFDPSLKDHWPDFEAAATALLDAAKSDEDFRVRNSCLKVLSQFAPDDPRIINLYDEWLTDPEIRIRMWGVAGLQSMAPSSAKAREALTTAILSQDPDVRNTAIRAFKQIRGEPDLLLPPLIEVLKDEYQDGLQTSRFNALHVLYRLESKAEPAVPAILEIFPKVPRERRDAVVAVLGQIGPGAIKAIPILQKEARESNNANYRKKVAEAFRSISKTTE